MEANEALGQNSTLKYFSEYQSPIKKNDACEPLNNTKHGNLLESNEFKLLNLQLQERPEPQQSPPRALTKKLTGAFQLQPLHQYQQHVRQQYSQQCTNQKRAHTFLKSSRLYLNEYHLYGKAQLIIINSLGGSYTPCLYVVMEMAPLSYNQESPKKLVQGQLFGELYYYNPYSCRMEPIIEKCGVQLFALFNQNSRD